VIQVIRTENTLC